MGNRAVALLVAYAAGVSVVGCGDETEDGGDGKGNSSSGGTAGAGGANRGGSDAGESGSGGEGRGGSGQAGRGGTAQAGQAGADSGGEGGTADGGAGVGGDDGGASGDGGEAGSAGTSGGGSGSGGTGGGGIGGGGSGGSGGIANCTPSISSAVSAHVAAMATEGWAARNAENGLTMHGCAGAAGPADCLVSYPLARNTMFGASWENVSGGISGAAMRVLRTLGYATRYRTRSSADGRFVGHGASNPGTADFTFIDLEQNREFFGNALYDPEFFPDTSGFLAIGSGPRACKQSVLSGSPTSVTFQEPSCSSLTNLGLWPSVGTTLDANDYFGVSGEFVSDDGGHSATLTDPATPYSGLALVRFLRFIDNGSIFASQFTQDVVVGSAGDVAISPSARLLGMRVGRPGGQVGYSLLRVDINRGSPVTVAVTGIARYCTNGGTPMFSFDERYMAFHHYIGDADAVDLGFSSASAPGFAAYRTEGAANVYLVDLTTGVRTRVTNMAAGQYALYPHFRSDGWLYFLVRDAISDTEYVAASNAAILAPR